MPNDIVLDVVLYGPILVNGDNPTAVVASPDVWTMVLVQRQVPQQNRLRPLAHGADEQVPEIPD